MDDCEVRLLRAPEPLAWALGVTGVLNGMFIADVSVALRHALYSCGFGRILPREDFDTSERAALAAVFGIAFFITGAALARNLKAGDRITWLAGFALVFAAFVGGGVAQVVSDSGLALSLLAAVVSLPWCVEVVAGIHSRSDCTTQAIDTRVDDYLDEINSFIGETAQPECFEDGQCASGCGAVDPDCPCASDGLCSDTCPDPSSDPDCQPTCVADGACDVACAEGLDPDCEAVEPSPTPEGGWVAGDAENEDYDGQLLGGCALTRARAAERSGERLGWLLLGCLGLLIRRRR